MSGSNSWTMDKWQRSSKSGNDNRWVLHMIDNDQWRMADDVHWCGADIQRSALLHSTKIVMASYSHRLVANRSIFFFFFWAEDKFRFMNFVGVKLLLLEIGDFWESVSYSPNPNRGGSHYFDFNFTFQFV